MQTMSNMQLRNPIHASYICHDWTDDVTVHASFVTTKVRLSRFFFFRGKHTFVATKMILVAFSAIDKRKGRYRRHELKHYSSKTVFICSVHFQNRPADGQKESAWAPVFHVSNVSQVRPSKTTSNTNERFKIRHRVIEGEQQNRILYGANNNNNMLAASDPIV